jgi:cation:H+ antiporter
MILAAAILGVGIASLFAGAHALVLGASQLGLRLKLSPLFIGLTVVACGTSLPELIVSFLAGLRGESDIAIGNVVGSNIANLGLVLGTAAIVSPLCLRAMDVSRDLGVSIFATVVFGSLVVNGQLGRVEGTLLVAGLVMYLGWSYKRAQVRGAVIAESVIKAIPRVPSLVKSLAAVVGGLVFLILGAQWTVDGAVGIAELAGISRAVVGLTIVAVGTSLPEFATSVVAAVKKEPAISVGNVLGSNIFNLFGILGISASARPLAVAGSILRYDLPVVLGLSVLCVPIIISGRRISRAEGLLLLSLYVVYCVWLFSLRGSGA